MGTWIMSGTREVRNKGRCNARPQPISFARMLGCRRPARMLLMLRPSAKTPKEKDREDMNDQLENAGLEAFSPAFKSRAGATTLQGGVKM